MKLLTPQEASNSVFEKAVFGGYDIAAVDQFVEKLSKDYAELYRESETLKDRIRLLADRIEEYRTSEDAMRLALLSAKKAAREAEERAGRAEAAAAAAAADDRAREAAAATAPQPDALAAARAESAACLERFRAAAAACEAAMEAFCGGSEAAAGEAASTGSGAAGSDESAEPEQTEVTDFGALDFRFRRE